MGPLYCPCREVIITSLWLPFWSAQYDPWRESWWVVPVLLLNFLCLVVQIILSVKFWLFSNPSFLTFNLGAIKTMTWVPTWFGWEIRKIIFIWRPEIDLTHYPFCFMDPSIQIDTVKYGPRSHTNNITLEVWSLYKFYSLKFESSQHHYVFNITIVFYLKAFYRFQAFS